MAQKRRRTSQELTKTLIGFLNKQKEAISRRELCKELGISTETADIWLKIGLMFKNDCPAYNYDKAGSIGIIKVQNEVNT